MSVSLALLVPGTSLQGVLLTASDMGEQSSNTNSDILIHGGVLLPIPFPPVGIWGEVRSVAPFTHIYKVPAALP